MTLYEITNWNALYENNRSRLVQKLDWVPVPNSHDGEGYARIITHKKAAQIFAAWIILLQVASRSTPRGQLVRATGEAHDSESLALKTRAPAAWFSDALPFLEKIGWLTRKQLPDMELALGRQSGDVHDVTYPSTKGREGKGREGKEEKEEKEEKAAASPLPLPFDSPEFRSTWELFEKHRREIRKPLTPTASKLSLEMLARIGEQRALDCIRHTIEKGWQGLREREGPAPKGGDAPRKPSAEAPGWKAWLNHEYAGSRFSYGGESRASEWVQLDKSAQDLLWRDKRAGKF